MIKSVSSYVTSAASVELEGFDSEWEVMIIWIENEGPVDDGFLKALCFVTGWDNGTRFAGCKTIFYTYGLCEVIVVDFDVVNDDSPFV